MDRKTNKVTPPARPRSSVSSTFFFILTVVIDCLMVWAAFAFALILKRWLAGAGWVPPGPAFSEPWHELFGTFAFYPPDGSGLYRWRLILPISMAGIYCSFKYFGLYIDRRFFTPVNMTGQVMKALLGYFMLLVAGLYLIKLPISRLVLFFFGILCVVFILVGRALIAKLRLYLRQKNICDNLNILLIGEGDIPVQIANRILKDDLLGYRLKGYVARKPDERMPVEYLGDDDSLKDVCKQEKIDEIFYIRPDRPISDMMKLITACREMGIDVRAVHPKCNIIVFRVKAFFDSIHGMPIVDFGTGYVTWWRRFIKRTVDVFGSLFGIVVFLPIWVLIAAIIKITSKGPVFFVQERLTENARPFNFLKFRSMRQGSHEKDTHRDYMRAFVKGEHEITTKEDGTKIHKITNDSRITPIGGFLRKYSLDEFPQLLNVLKGDMSMVGPRPPIRYEVEMYEPWHNKRLNGRGGITGLWQISGRNELNFDEQVMLDIYYLRNHSLFLDYSIILRTFFVVFGWQSGF